jgi:hypothetical protein
MTKTRLYLDVDGVLNAWYADHMWGALKEGVGGVYTIKWAPAMVEELNKLDVDLVWLTTWRDEAPETIAPLLGVKLPSRVLHPLSGVTTFPSMWWKFEAVRHDQEQNPGRFLWFDDELEIHHVIYAQKTNGLALPVDHNLGITPGQIELAKVFIATGDSLDSQAPSA